MIGGSAGNYFQVSMRINTSRWQWFWKWGYPAITFAIISISHLPSFLIL
jgi:hypothetical protein